MNITLRPASAEDDPFLFEVYASTRREEMSAWGWNPAQQDTFLRLQYMAQRRSYEMQYPEANYDIILLDGHAIGKFYAARTAEDIQFTDIALLPEYRGQGIGTQLIKDLLDEAAQSAKPCRLHVLRENRAVRLYERLGFKTTAEDAMYFSMEWRANEG